ncbi:MAG: DUF962 domain-containing protein [Legionella sp.]|nr:DUF962 domain-containing protein [Legionella sp.]
MKTFIEQAHFYAEYHQKKETLYTHLIGIPLIILSLMIFLGFFQLIVPGVIATTLASIGTLVLFIYYLRLNWQLALLFAPILVLLLWISSLVSYAGPTAFALWTFIIVFILGWGLQFVGHMIEGRKPALIDNATHALVAPLFLTAEVCFMLGRMQTLKEQVHGTPSITAASV